MLVDYRVDRRQTRKDLKPAWIFVFLFFPSPVKRQRLLHVPFARLVRPAPIQAEHPLAYARVVAAVWIEGCGVRIHKECHLAYVRGILVHALVVPLWF